MTRAQTISSKAKQKHLCWVRLDSVATITSGAASNYSTPDFVRCFLETDY